MALLYLIAAWALVTGILSIVTAFQLRKETRIEGEWLLILGGHASLLFGLFPFAYPSAGALSPIWLIGTCASIFGMLQMVLAFNERDLISKRGAE